MGINAIRMFRRRNPEETGRAGAGGREAVVSKRLLGEKWRQYRLERGFLLEDVANAVGISASYLSKIELTQTNASYDILQKLADFYGENILYYLSAREDGEPLVKKNQGEKLHTDVAGLIIESVVARKEATISSMIYSVAPGCGRAKPSRHSGEEFVHVLKGEIHMSLDGQIYQMTAGDSLSFQSRQDHSWRNPGDKTARLLWVYTPLVKPIA
jgi:transcriptional regulator with XRE-family HTH domain